MKVEAEEEEEGVDSEEVVLEGVHTGVEVADLVAAESVPGRGAHSAPVEDERSLGMPATLQLLTLDTV